MFTRDYMPRQTSCLVFMNTNYCCRSLNKVLTYFLKVPQRNGAMEWKRFSKSLSFPLESTSFTVEGGNLLCQLLMCPRFNLFFNISNNYFLNYRALKSFQLHLLTKILFNSFILGQAYGWWFYKKKLSAMKICCCFLGNLLNIGLWIKDSR